MKSTYRLTKDTILALTRVIARVEEHCAWNIDKDDEKLINDFMDIVEKDDGEDEPDITCYNCENYISGDCTSDPDEMEEDYCDGHSIFYK